MWVVFVDALVTVLVGEAEVGGKVDDGNARFRKPLCMLHASGVGNGGKHYVAGKQRFVIMGYEGLSWDRRVQVLGKACLFRCPLRLLP